ncbi:MAG TPA: hypothetical protein VJ888_03250 [Mobilitalea sp.]|nr:hypothetical protein [Mobilitalea sp.]
MTINGLGDQISGCSKLINVSSFATLNIYDSVMLRNNDVSETYGGAIYVDSDGVLNMYGGSITEIKVNYGTIWNQGTFYLKGGSIHNNRASYGGGIWNYGTLIMDGGRIYNNSASGSGSGGGVYNAESMRMNGGYITDNTASEGAGIKNYGVLELNGGEIRRNNANYGGGIYNNSSLKMTGGYIGENTASYYGGGICLYNHSTELTGGLIENNRGSIKGGAIGEIGTMGELKLSGDIRIPAGLTDNDIYMKNTIVLAGTLNSADNMLISSNFYNEKPVLSGAAELIAQYHSLFKPINENYEVNDTGRLNYLGETATYYVGGAGAYDYYSGSEAGSIDYPFATLQKALAKNEENSCEIILQSDITVNDYLYSRGDVTIKSKGTDKYKVTVGSEQGEIIMNYGSLSLGDRNNQNAEDSLIFDGNQKDIQYYAITNYGNINLYSGVKFTNFITRDFASNSGSIHMYGGSISSNTSRLSMFYNEYYNAYFHMYGGTISNNIIGQNLITSVGVNKISGGIISGNTSGYSLISVSDTFLMSGGTICNNTAPTVVSVYNDATFQMSAGTICENSGYGIENGGTLQMSGGTIRDNALGGINMDADSNGSLQLSGNISISAVAPAPGIILSGSNRRIVIAGALNNDEVITVAANSYTFDYPMLIGDPDMIKEYRGQFTLLDEKYEIDESGSLIFVGDRKTYYVNENSEADIFDGNIDTPFKTIQEAVAAIGTGMGTVILQSNITLTSPIVVQGTIILTDDGKGQYTILRDDSYTSLIYEDDEYSQMIIVNGKLVIGNKDNSGDDDNLSLIIDGGMEEKVGPYDEILLNNAVVEIYSGVSLQHNNSYSYAGGIVNYGIVLMYGGQIDYNVGYRCGGVLQQPGASFIMNGGSIKDNIGGDVGGINTYGGSCFTMNGGLISGNIGRVGGIYALSRDRFDETKSAIITLNGGTVKGNSGTNIYDESTLIPGILIGEETTLRMSKEILITDGDQLAICQNFANEAIEVTGAFTLKDKVANVAVYENIDIDEGGYVPVLVNPYGLKLLVSGEGYTITEEDSGKFSLLSPSSENQEYAINSEGRVGTVFEEDWVSIKNNVGIIYDCTAKAVTVTVSDRTTTYINGIDYYITYRNNINPGTATVMICGIGSHAGVITKTFQIAGIPTQDTPNLGPVIYTGLDSDKTLNINIDLSGDEEATSSGDIRISINKEQLKKISDESVVKVKLGIQVPNSMFTHNPEQKQSILLDEELLEAAGESGKQLEVTIKDEDGKERYTWSFNGEEVAASGKEMKEVNLSIGISEFSEHNKLESLIGDKTGLILSFAQDGELPITANVRIYVGDQKGVEPGSKIYLYHYNNKNNKLETLPYSSNYEVDKDGFITVNIVHCSDYIALTEKADSKSITSLRNQISVIPLARILYTDGTKGQSVVMKVKLPATLEQVDSLSEKETLSVAIGGITISYTSSNSKIATVNKAGEVKAVGVGSAVVTTTIRLYSGKTKTVKTKIIVKESKE